jgi:hypothetical protein
LFWTKCTGSSRNWAGLERRSVQRDELSEQIAKEAVENNSGWVAWAEKQTRMTVIDAGCETA